MQSTSIYINISGVKHCKSTKSFEPQNYLNKLIEQQIGNKEKKEIGIGHSSSFTCYKYYQVVLERC